VNDFDFHAADSCKDRFHGGDAYGGRVVPVHVTRFRLGPDPMSRERA
jgi:hypothetical protein